MGWNPFRRAPLLHVADDRGSGPVVVFIHGIASSSITWTNVVPLLEDRFRCISIDLLGFGGSPIPEHADYTLAEHVAAIARTVASLRLREPFVLVGHSMGGLIAPRYAARHPKQVRRLVLVSPPIYITPTALSMDRDRSVQQFYLRAYKWLRENPAFTIKNGGIIGDMLAIPRSMDINERTWVPFVKSLEHTIESQTTISDLAALRVPVEIVYGDLDEFSSPGGMRIAERIRGVTVTRVRGADHLIGKRLARAVARSVDEE
ncbi:alpha/beta fold hydrolase [Protaetiibacter intestinalis]|uniref:Alpha/beta hydrolase n=1 Tax=Protaetiibacter intestinalis TaxID=2419774 RepID=A0A387B6B1_9MICO|nr:alpha/beta hydrolase [Protaetiibacter intestinalis]AYF97291.1 alpha/beta hydrolase [Protaetiibacter intestinalis]